MNNWWLCCLDCKRRVKVPCGSEQITCGCGRGYNLRRTAIHEAGHIVAMVDCEAPIRSVSIRPGTHAERGVEAAHLGIVRQGKERRRRRPHWYFYAEWERASEAVAIYYGGAAAVEVWLSASSTRPERPHSLPNSVADLVKAAEAGARGHCPGEFIMRLHAAGLDGDHLCEQLPEFRGKDPVERALVAEWLWVRTCNMMAAPWNWAAVTKLADLLLHKPTMGGKEAEELVWDVWANDESEGNPH